jgi:hypothetical protein
MMRAALLWFGKGDPGEVMAIMMDLAVMGLFQLRAQLAVVVVVLVVGVSLVRLAWCGRTAPHEHDPQAPHRDNADTAHVATDQP